FAQASGQARRAGWVRGVLLLLRAHYSRHAHGTGGRGRRRWAAGRADPGAPRGRPRPPGRRELPGDGLPEVLPPAGELTRELDGMNGIDKIGRETLIDCLSDPVCPL